MTDIQFFGHTHAAVELHSLLSNVRRRFGCLNFEGAYRSLGLHSVTFIHSYSRHVQ